MHTITSTWMELLGQFFQMFTEPGAKIFARLITGWVLCTARRTVTGMLPFADPLNLHAHDAYHRFFPDARWKMRRLWQRLVLMAIKQYGPKAELTFALDDTLFHHSGQKMEGTGAWRDAVRSTKKKVVYAWGLNLVVMTLQIQPPWGGEPLGLPVNMRMHRKKGSTLIELAVEMIQDIRDWLGERPFRVVGDGFYATLAGKCLPGVTIISRLRRDANLYDLLPKKNRQKRRGRPRTKGKKLAKLEKMAAHIQNWTEVEYYQRGTTDKRLVYYRRVLWPTVTKNPIKLLISRDPEGHEKDDFLFTTNLSMSAEDVLTCYGDRWAIEDTFRNAKQYLGVQEPQTYKRQGPERAAALGLWLYSIVWLWYLTRKPSQRKSTPSFTDALRCLRRELWSERINTMFGKGAAHDHKFEFLIDALANAA